MLIARGAKVNAKNNSGYTPLDFANKHNYTEIANLLREYNERF
jgi:ankyrin repeat protein